MSEEEKGITRRGFIAGSTAAVGAIWLGGIPVPRGVPAPKEDGRCALWVVFVAGSIKHAHEEFERGVARAKRAGFEVFGHLHNAYGSSRFLARKEVSLAYARKQERRIAQDQPHDFREVGEEIVTWWVEVAA